MSKLGPWMYLHGQLQKAFEIPFQSIQSAIMGFVTGTSKIIPVQMLLDECNWLHIQCTWVEGLKSLETPWLIVLLSPRMVFLTTFNDCPCSKRLHIMLGQSCSVLHQIYRGVGAIYLACTLIQDLSLPHWDLSHSSRLLIIQTLVD